jgi:transposase
MAAPSRPGPKPTTPSATTSRTTTTHGAATRPHETTAPSPFAARATPRFARLLPEAPSTPAALILRIQGVSIRVEAGFEQAPERQLELARFGFGLASSGGHGAVHEGRMIAHGLPVYVALEPVDMRLGYERLGGIVRERMQAEPRSRALFVFVGKRGHTMKILTWDGTGAIVIHKKLDAGRFELPKPTCVGEQQVMVSDALFEVIYKGVRIAPKAPRRRIH